MTRIVIDSWAWVEYLSGSIRGEKVRKVLEYESNEVFSSTVTMAEVSSKFHRSGKNPEIAREAISRLSKMISLDPETAFNAGEIHAKMRQEISDFGLADAIVIALASKLDAKILTGDPHFKNVRNAIMI